MDSTALQEVEKKHAQNNLILQYPAIVFNFTAFCSVSNPLLFGLIAACWNIQHRLK